MDNIKIKALKHKGCCFLSAVSLLTGISSSEAIAGKINQEEDYRVTRKRQEAKAAVKRNEKQAAENRERQAFARFEYNLEDYKKLKEKKEGEYLKAKRTQQSLNGRVFGFLENLIKLPN